jgi:hypothetical protein
MILSWDMGQSKSYAFTREPTRRILDQRPHRSTGFTPKAVPLTFFSRDVGQNYGQRRDRQGACPYVISFQHGLESQR